MNKIRKIRFNIFYHTLFIDYSLIIFFSSGKFDYDHNLETCSIIKDRHGHTSKTFLFIMGFLIPCVVIVGCYAKIFWVVHK